jgi:hypothetical protein
LSFVIGFPEDRVVFIRPLVSRLGQLSFSTASALLVLLCTPPARAENGEPAKLSSTDWAIIPGGVADAAGTTAYFAGSGDIIEAIDMRDGKTLWDSKEAVRPVALDGQRLIAQGKHAQQPNVMNIVILDAASGKVRSQSEPVVFPDWIAIDGGIGLTFAAAPAIEDGQLVLRWEAFRQFVQPGPKVTPEIMAAAKKAGSGVARVDLETGRANVTVDDVPKPLKQSRLAQFTDVGDRRLRVSERTENVPGGIQLIRRTIEAADKRSGRPVWRHEIAGDILLPDVPPTAGRMQPNPGSQRR